MSPFSNSLPSSFLDNCYCMYHTGSDEFSDSSIAIRVVFSSNPFHSDGFMSTTFLLHLRAALSICFPHANVDCEFVAASRYSSRICGVSELLMPYINLLIDDVYEQVFEFLTPEL